MCTVAVVMGTLTTGTGAHNFSQTIAQTISKKRGCGISDLKMLCFFILIIIIIVLGNDKKLQSLLIACLFCD